MNLINELQVSAEQDDVLTVLRKTTRLVSKLDRQDISAWLRYEQSGYPEDHHVPDYRRVGVRVAFNTNGFIPAGFGRIMNGIQELPSLGINPRVAVCNSISEVQTWIDGMAKGHGIFQPVSQEADRAVRAVYQFDPMVSRQITLLLRLNDSEVRAIPERIKDRVLEWACALERAGVTGDGMSFTAQERAIAHKVTFNISGSHIEQLNNMGINQRGNE